MRLLVFICLLLIKSSYSQTITVKEFGVMVNYGTTKFHKTGKSGFGIPYITSNPPPKTVFVCDILPSFTLAVTKKLNISTFAGIEIHKIRTLFTDYGYKPYITNYLWKAGIGPEFILIGHNKSMLNVKLTTYLTIEDFLKNNTGPFQTQDVFGNRYYMYDYYGSKARFGTDFLPFIDVQILPKLSLKVTAGYSLGLNHSNKRVVLYNEGTLIKEVEIFNRKESCFIFSCCISYNYSKSNRKSLNTLVNSIQK